MKTVLILAAALLAAPVAAAPKKPAPSAKDAAERFSLDLAPAGEDSSVTAPSEPDAPPASDSPAPRFSLDTPIAQLLANYRSKAVLDRDMPGLSTDKNLDKIKALSLNALAPASGGRLSPALLEKVRKHLAAIE